MFNVGSGELLVILLVALIFLGPDKLPETARKIGKVLSELRRMSQGFQDEVRSAMDFTSEQPDAQTSAGPRLVAPPSTPIETTAVDETPTGPAPGPEEASGAGGTSAA